MDMRFSRTATSRRLPHHLHRRRRLPENLPRRGAGGGGIEFVEIGGPGCRLQRVGIRRGVTREPRANGSVPEPEFVRCVDGEDFGVREIWCSGSEAHGGWWGRGRYGPSDVYTDAAVVVDLGVGAKWVPAVEGDDVIVDVKLGYGGGGLTRKPGLDQYCGCSVFEEE